jgi:phosphomannomutase
MTSQRKPLQFGTDGWRGVIADDFTFANLERVAQATAAVIVDPERPASVVVGHDRRFLAAAHADRVGEVLAGNGLAVIRTDTPAPTPAVSGLVVDRRACAGIVITASHNPAEFGGLKIKTATGRSAGPDLTRAVEARLDRAVPRRRPAGEAKRAGLWEAVDFRPGYLSRLARRVDRGRIAATQPLTVVVDSMHGCGAHLVADFLAETPHRVVTLRGDADPLFGGAGPEPLPERLQALCQAVRQERADLGIATDGDADRLAAVDNTGRFLSALQITPLLADYLIRLRGERGMVAKTFANTLLLDRIAAAHGLPFRVFPIGFKHLAPLLETGEILIGGEESGGIGVAGYLPERDGVLIGLLLVEMRAASGRPLSDLLSDLWQRYGEYHYRRQDLALPAEDGRRVVERVLRGPPAKIAGFDVSAIEDLDGIKLQLGDTGWVMIRPSGTEPVLRFYCEARRIAEVDAILRQAVRLVAP